ncbi:phytyl ester synthase 1, chloroplastic-like isoform X1 [Lycium barbarum]|uniref:phytyl ester synthase 1, chloroplastic-like isoform X1 n=1 Tax=Lycium barbarum TaxID=112863 RepID=UPI00293EED9A|nr:phytyl ester synthase 1, chloroplastic-like isoform X1 [Lycium barbarum]XP_060218060.1 phytyl ester synthase 1, chloroplastic-like isoform X1 [Lycium barbarum]XP_060218061.1 phytyl ester synthase 1, chloroplastic-like isoform X1 [Lycium barbarum]XP_060218062.1 phytyl ester synthase 1, chloroplastic-like isoform X1 [Lycium barbarum]
MVSLPQNFWAAPHFARHPGYKPQCISRITCLASRDSTFLPSDSVKVNGVSSIEEKEKSIPVVDVQNDHLDKSKEDMRNKLEPLWDDGYGTQTVKDYLEIGLEIIKPDGGPPRWFTPISAGPPLQESPLLLFLPGTDGTGMGLVLHEKALGKVFQVWCLHIPVYDRTPFDELVNFVERTVRLKHASSPNKPIYLVGDSFGGCLALAVAAHNPKIDLVLILVNPATSFGKSQLQPLLPLLESLPDEIHVMVPYLMSFIMGDPMKMAMVNIDSMLPPGQIIRRLSDNLTSLLAYLPGLADIIPKETLLWKLKLLRSASSYSNSRLHAVNAEVLVIASGKDNMFPSGDEAQRLANSLRNCKVQYFKDNAHTILLEDGINLLSIIKGTSKYRRKKRHDPVMDFLLPTMSEFKNTIQDYSWYLNFTGPVMLSTLENGKIVRGLAGVPREGPVLLVGYHMLMGLDSIPLVLECLRQRKILLRGIAHPVLFTQRTESRTNESSFNDLLRLSGFMPVSASNLFKLLATKSHILLYPGGAREALHRKGEEYKVIWPDQPEFIRMAAKFGATIVPFGVVGEDDIAQLVLDYDDLKNIPILGDGIRYYNEHAARSGLTVRTDMDEEVANQALYLPGVLPKIPGRFYYLFGKPIHTKGRKDLVKDREKARELYLQVKSEVQNNMNYLLKKREEDPYRSVIDRTVHKAFSATFDDVPTFDY